MQHLQQSATKHYQYPEHWQGGGRLVQDDTVPANTADVDQVSAIYDLR